MNNWKRDKYKTAWSCNTTWHLFSILRIRKVLLCLLPACFVLFSCLSYSSTLKMRRHVPPKLRLTSNGLHGVISHEIILSITTAVGTSNRIPLFHGFYQSFPDDEVAPQLGQRPSLFPSLKHKFPDNNSDSGRYETEQNHNKLVISSFAYDAIKLKSLKYIERPLCYL
jgi:hypothetical protein